MSAPGWFLIGAPWDSSGTGRGEESSPMALRDAGLSSLLSNDLGDASTTIDNIERDEATGVLALAETARAARALADFLFEAMTARPNHRALVVGGDCSMLLGIFPALRQRFGPVGLWFFDGHPDYLDGETSETGETADMELAILTGDGAPTLTNLAGAPMVHPEDVALLGHRTEDLDEPSAVELRRLPAELRRIDAAAIVADPTAAGTLARSWLSARNRPVWLHIDLDVLDPGVLPAVTYPQARGLNWDALAEAIEPLAASPLLVGVSIADFRPDLDPTGGLGKRIVRFLEETLLQKPRTEG